MWGAWRSGPTKVKRKGNARTAKPKAKARGQRSRTSSGSLRATAADEEVPRSRDGHRPGQRPGQARHEQRKWQQRQRDQENDGVSLNSEQPTQQTAAAG